MALFRRRPVEASVTALTWSRVIALERREWVPKRSSWVPSDDVRNVQKRTEQYLETVTESQPGTIGANGMPGPPTTTTRMEPRFRTYYTYEALVWHQGRALTASGTHADEVRWPDCELALEERVSARTETYTAAFAADGRDYTTDLPEPEWRALEPGARCHLTLGLFGGVKEVG